jgi:hypothetical protein
MVQTLLANREDIFPMYDVPGFESAFEQHFVIDRREPVKETDRILYLMRKK